MGIHLEKLKKNQICSDYFKKSYELIEKFKLTEDLQYIYFSFKNKFLETKEVICYFNLKSYEFNFKEAIKLRKI